MVEAAAAEGTDIFGMPLVDGNPDSGPPEGSE